ncbi:hypothetical protein [Tenacibaculum sp. 190524A02b]|uniref:phage tail protein n=1 Tax=Tenacibaculum vairaonense TaxID=3137860 RepID=UPI0031FB4BE9
MFVAKQNNNKPSAKPTVKSNKFIPPKMKVVKPKDAQEATNKAKEKVQEAQPEKATTFFKPEAKATIPTKTGVKKEAAKGKPGTSNLALKTNKTEAAKKETKEPKETIVEIAHKKKEEVGKGKQKAKKEQVAKEGAQNIPKAPTRPQDDPAFKKQIKHTENVKTEQSQHPEPETKVTEQKGASHLPAKAQSSKNNQQAFMTEMDETSKQERKPFTAESFKKTLKKNLDALENDLPSNSDEAKEFKKEKPIQKVKESISGEVTAQSDTLAGPMKNKAKQPLEDKGLPTTEAEPLQPVTPQKPPKPIVAKAAVPKPKTKQEISMEKESQSLDTYMDENEVTEKQLAKSNEPKFTTALDQKTQAQTEAKLAPINYKKKEKATLSKATKVATKDGAKGLDSMKAAKMLSEKNVLKGQQTGEKSDKDQQKEIYTAFENIYKETKKTVTEKLEKLSTGVDSYFSVQAENAKKTFEKNVEERLDDIYGWTTLDDKLFGEDTEAIERAFEIEKSKFIKTMDGVLDKIAEEVAKGLNEALEAIEEGKRKSKEKFESLDASQQKLAKDAFEEFNDQYASLEDTVYEKQDELAQDLANAYKKNVDSLRESFDEIKEKVSAGWIGAAFNALAGVVKTILKIKDLLLNLLAAAASAIGAIIADPIGFLSNLIKGIKQGFVDFGTNIKKHLIKGLIEWLTGSLGNVGITLPDNLFSLSGIFNLVAQMLGLTWDYFRSKAVKLLGEPVVAGMEKAVEIFKIVKKDGVKGLWEYIKEQFNNLKEMVMDAIRDMIITKVIEAGIKWIMGLLSPAGAFVKAAMMIIDIVKFFVERAAQIFELVTAFVNSIKALAAGNVKAVAKGIETALAKAIPVLIGFLASLLGITGLTAKVQKIIKKVRKKIDKAIDKIIKKAKKLFGRGKKGKKVSKDKLKEKDKNENEEKKDELKDIKKSLSKDIKKELKKGYGPKSLKKKIKQWKKKYKLKKLELKGGKLLLKLNPEDQLDAIDSITLGKLLIPILAKAEQEYVELFIDGEAEVRAKVEAKKKEMKEGKSDLTGAAPDVNQQILRESSLQKPTGKTRGRTEVGGGTTVSHQTTGSFATYKVENIGEYKDLVNIGGDIASFFEDKKVPGVTTSYMNNAIKGILSTGNPTSRSSKKQALLRFLKSKEREYRNGVGKGKDPRKGVLDKIGVYERTLNRLIVLVQELEPIRQDGMAATTAMQHQLDKTDPNRTLNDQLSPDGKNPMTPKGASMQPQAKETKDRKTTREGAEQKRFKRTGDIFKDFAKMAGNVEVFVPAEGTYDLKPLEKHLRDWVKLKIDFDNIPKTDPKLAEKAQKEVDDAEKKFKDEIMLMMLDYNGRM